MANILTGIRILCGILLMCFPAFSDWFYLFYLIGGMTDAVDGTVARKRGEVSDFGSAFDTVADFVFAVAVAFQIIGNVCIPLHLTVWVGMIAFIKMAGHLAGYLKYHSFKTVHSVLNKVCGGAVFAVPLLLGGNLAWEAKSFAVIAVCILASAAAIAEAVALLKKQ